MTAQEAADADGKRELSSDHAMLAIPLDEAGIVQLLPLGDLRDVLLDLRDGLTQAGEVFRSARHRDGGRAGYAHVIRTVQILADQLPWLCTDDVRAALTLFLADLNAVETGKSQPQAFKPAIGGSTAHPVMALRNTTAAVALDLMHADGTPLAEAAAQIARRLVSTGHRRDQRGADGAANAAITAKTVTEWRRECRRMNGMSAGVSRTLFLDYVASGTAYGRRPAAERYIELLCSGPMFAPCRHCG